MNTLFSLGQYSLKYFSVLYLSVRKPVHDLKSSYVYIYTMYIAWIIDFLFVKTVLVFDIYSSLVGGSWWMVLYTSRFRQWRRVGDWNGTACAFFFFFFIFISWRLITLQYCSGFCHTLTSISHRFACVPHPNTPSHLPPYPISLLYLQSRSFFPLANSCDFSITYKFSKHRFISYFPEISDTVNLKWCLKSSFQVIILTLGLILS